MTSSAEDSLYPLPRGLRRRILTIIGLSLVITYLVVCTAAVSFTYTNERSYWLETEQRALDSAVGIINRDLDHVFHTLMVINQMTADGQVSGNVSVLELVDQHEEIVELAMIDNRGSIVSSITRGQIIYFEPASTVPLVETLHAADGVPFYQILTHNPHPGIHLLAAIPTGDGGVLAARFHMNNLQVAISSIHLGETGRVYVIDRQGNVIADSGVQPLPEDLFITDPVLRHEALHAATALFSTTRSGRNYLISNTTIPGTDWTAVAEVERSETVARTLGSWKLLLGILVVMALPMHAGSKTFTRYLVRPIREMLVGVERIGGGDLAYRIKMDSQDELSALAEAINVMADRLSHQRSQMAANAAENARLAGQVQSELGERQRAEEALRILNQQLEERVSQRTGELQSANDELTAEIARRQHSEERLRQVTDNMLDIIVQTDAKGRILYASPSLHSLLGYSFEMMQRHTMMDFVYPEDAPAAMQLIRQFGSDHNAPLRLETRYCCADGRVIWLESIANPILAVSGEMTGAIVSCRDVTDRKRMEEQVLASLREKEVLLKEIHHRVKNNLQVISSLLSLQSAGVGDAQAAAILQESQDRVRSMALIHEKLYQSSSLAQVDFGSYAQALTASLSRSYRIEPAKVTIQMDCEPVQLSVDTAVPCGLILNELIANALKYAFPDGRTGTIHVDLRADGQNARLLVADDGVGLPDGLEWKSAASLGLKLVNTLTEQIDGRITISTHPGTRIELTFPTA